MGKDLISPLFIKLQSGFNQKVTLIHEGVSIELQVQGEEAVGQIFDHFPLAQLTGVQNPDYQVQWINSQDYGFSPLEWREEINMDYTVGPKQVYVKPDYLAMIEGWRITLVASYEIGAGFLDFLKWLVAKT